MELQDLDYDLPRQAIAQRPADPRDAARMLVDEGPGRAPSDLTVRDLPALTGPGDVVVINTTRVSPARLRLRKVTGGAVEVLLLERDHTATGREGGEAWTALVRPGRRVPPGTHLEAGPDLTVVVGDAAGPDGVRHVELVGADPAASLGRHGRLALPPYIDDDLDDPERYQTVYADRPGSVAAPTAGLHLTRDVLDAIAARGASIQSTELEVGIGTFRPIQTAHLDDHVMHRERYRVPEATMTACERADRVVAVGTTTVRALESAAAGPLEGFSELFIRPGYDFAVVDALLTNFHQPRSTLLALLAAFVGPRWRDLYEHARGSGYRFLSLGDAMFLPSRAI